ncbi:hypothetical protein HBI24_214610 [Parastagonospora nodorum]|nr:hypothetical protein HBI75_199280 [Parastagonospora nodorum]KAH5176799.1 hypothetical protein HBH76_209190 [Parastagonospora nodorum]KAH5493963.1 hypothetical protein HBI52_205810 [Parastagonospora nodorum]KAH5571225.1 hypothetical protein HBI24_214610 [Parastagonospora nodorum]KAH5667481.1 hypothetical protein HBI44_220260 [Parastagonospora nodorum]
MCVPKVLKDLLNVPKAAKDLPHVPKLAGAHAYSSSLLETARHHSKLQKACLAAEWCKPFSPSPVLSKPIQKSAMSFPRFRRKVHVDLLHVCGSKRDTRKRISVKRRALRFKRTVLRLHDLLRL